MKGFSKTFTKQMEELHYRLIERMRQHPQALSRNRNFHVFDDPGLRRARRIYRYLRSLEKDLLTYGHSEEIRVDTNAIGVTITFGITAIRGKRTAFLHHKEFQILLENPQIRSILEI